MSHSARHNRTHHWLPLEALEPRALLDAVFPTDAEQYMVELINRARANPQAEAARLGIALNEGIAPGTISDAPKQPLAINPFLTDAARKHSDYLLAHNQWDHNQRDDQGNVINTPRQRMTEAGYPFDFSSWSGENLARVGLTNLKSTMDRSHSLLFIDEGIAGRGHRTNLMHVAFAEIGVGVDIGTANGHTVALTTEDFASSGTNPFLTGVVFTDLIDTNNFYTPGEGVGGVLISALRQGSETPVETTTWDAGGYSVRLPAGTYTVTVSGGPFTEPFVRQDIVIGGQNVKLDYDLDSIIPPPPPDLVGVFGPVASPVVVIPGQRDTLPVGIVNEGLGRATGNATLLFYLSLDNTLDEATDRLVVTTAPIALNLATDESKVVTVPVQVPTDMPPGSYNLLAKIVSTLTVSEEVTGNNLINVTTNDTPIVTNVVWQFGNVPGRLGVTTLTLDNQGVATTFALKGAGMGTVTPGVGAGGNGMSVALTGTNATGALTITSPKGTAASIIDITADGSLKSITGKTTTLRGDIDIAGTLTTLTLATVADNHLIHIDDQAGLFLPVSMTFGSVANLSIQSDVPIKALTVTGDWVDDDNDPDVITAPSIAALTAKGAFQAGLSLTGVGPLGAIVGNTLGKATIAGGLREAAWVITGAVGAVTAKGEVDDLTLNATGAIKALTLGDVNAASVTSATDIATIKAVRWLSGAISAGGIKALTVAGAIKLGIRGDLGADVTTTDPLKLLGTLKVAGVLNQADVNAAGDIGTVALGAMLDSTVFAGVLPTGGAGGASLLPGAGARSFDTANPRTIKSITVNGANISGQSFINSAIAAATINKVVLTLVDTANLGTELGVAADLLIKSYQRDTLKILNITAPGDYDHQPDNDYFVRIV